MFSWDSENKMYWCRHKLSNGQYCMIAFEEFYMPTDNSTRHYSVVFAVADKKKQLRAWFENTKDSNITLKSTGRCGVEALFWARDRILEFEQILQSGDFDNAVIWVTGEDRRRFHLYEHALSRYGYKKVPSPWRETPYGWYMRKSIAINQNI